MALHMPATIDEIASMRYVVITLVLLNLVHLGWNLGWPLSEPDAREPSALLNSGLTLVSEFDARSLQAESEAGRLCSLVSGFENEAEAADFMAEAFRRGLDAAYAAGQSDRDRQYRVFLPPTPSVEIARLTLEDLAARLEAADITANIGLVTSGDDQNAIVLGRFDSATAAVSLRDRILVLGYSPQIERIHPEPERLKLWLRSPQYGRIETPEWLDLTRERPNLSRVENLCQTIAQPSQFQ